MAAIKFNLPTVDKVLSFHCGRVDSRRQRPYLYDGERRNFQYHEAIVTWQSAGDNTRGVWKSDVVLINDLNQ